MDEHQMSGLELFVLDVEEICTYCIAVHYVALHYVAFTLHVWATVVIMCMSCVTVSHSKKVHVSSQPLDGEATPDWEQKAKVRAWGEVCDAGI